MTELKDGQYQAALKLLTNAGDALQHAMTGLKRKEEARTIRRRVEEVESYLKKAKRELRIG
jgi:cellobiose-specific phosphotransferase system component IIA